MNAAYCSSHMNLQEEIIRFVEELNNSAIPAIVEGKKDKAALEELGIKQCLTLNKGEALYHVVESLTAKEIAILTDLDKEGKALYGKLHEECTRRGIKINNHLRNFLLKETPLGTIEGLPAFLRNNGNI